MTKEEFKAWAAFQMKNAGHWTVDPIHNGADRDLIAYIAKPNDPTSGIYVNVFKDGTWDCGRFEDAIPHMGEACYHPTKRGVRPKRNSASPEWREPERKPISEWRGALPCVTSGISSTRSK